jgi:D-glycero-alpha-D-manno-heptose-7-phosphate kinase
MIISRTPFRISFFGGGTDYPAYFNNFGHGKALSASINKYCYITCRYLPPFFEHNTRFAWSRVEVVKHTDEIIHPSARESLKFAGVREGVEVHYSADLPARSGLGSSSAFTVGFLNALYTLQGKPVTKQILTDHAIHIEQNLIGESVGCQDQAAVAFGGLNQITFGGDPTVSVSPMALSSDRLRDFEDHLLLFFTGTTRNAFEVAAVQIAMTASKVTELSLMRDLVDEAKVVLEGTDDITRIGSLLHKTWTLKRGLTHKISTSEIDQIYEAGLSAGALGGKLLGAGGGGFILFFAPPERHSAIRERLHKLLHVPFRFDHTGSQIMYRDFSDSVERVSLS